MNKNGFTLVELLATIAVLGIVIVIAIPTIGDVLEDSKKNTFLIDAGSIYRAANMYSLEIGDDGEIFYSKGQNKLDISRNDFDYCVKLNSEGEITLIAVSNGKYFIEGNSNFSSLNSDSVVNGNMDSYVCE